MSNDHVTGTINGLIAIAREAGVEAVVAYDDHEGKPILLEADATDAVVNWLKAVRDARLED